MSADEVAQSRGTPTVPGKESPYRNRSIEENLELFSKMKDGGFPDGTKTSRAKTDMSTPNMQMRDPVLTEYCALIITVQATNGASIQCMISRTGKAISSKESHIQYVLLNLKFIDLFMTGFLIRYAKKVKSDHDR